MKKNGWTLRYADNGQPYDGKPIQRRDGAPAVVVTGGNPPHKPSSTGRIWAQEGTHAGIPVNTHEWFPGVCGLKWTKDEEPGCRRPTLEELAELRQACRDQYGAEDDEDAFVRDENVAVFPRYMPDGPGQCGPIFVVLWPGGPEMVTVFGYDSGRNLVPVADTVRGEC